MRNTFKVLFFVKRNTVKKTGKAPIIARITVDQDKIQFYTKLEVAPDQWDVPPGKSNRKRQESLQINALPADIRMAVQMQYHPLLETDDYPTAERVRDAYLEKTEKHAPFSNSSPSTTSRICRR